MFITWEPTPIREPLQPWDIQEKPVRTFEYWDVVVVCGFIAGICLLALLLPKIFPI